MNADSYIHSTEADAKDVQMAVEGVGLWALISDLIPDEIEVMLNSFAISAHVVVFTFIISLMWCSTKVLVSVINGCKQDNHLRGM
jgi:hypothetical protein